MKYEILRKQVNNQQSVESRNFQRAVCNCFSVRYAITDKSQAIFLQWANENTTTFLKITKLSYVEDPIKIYIFSVQSWQTRKFFETER